MKFIRFTIYSTAILLLLYYGYEKYEVKNLFFTLISKSESEIVETIADGSDAYDADGVAGTIYMSLKNLDADEMIRQKYVSIYTLDLASGRIKRFLEEEPVIQYTVRDSGDAFAIALDDAADPHQKIVQYSNLTGKKTVVNTVDGSSERFLSWSETAKRLLYTVKTGDSLFDTSDFLDQRSIYIYDPVTAENTFVGKGGHPQWSPDGMYVLYMGNDGVYQYSQIKKDSNLVVPYETADSQEKVRLTEDDFLELSPDGEYAILAVPSAKSFYVLRIDNVDFDDFQYVTMWAYQSTTTQHYWPVFSPDSEYFITQAIDTVPESTERIKPRLEIRNVSDMKVLYSYSLNHFDFNQAFIDSWVQN